MNARPVPDVLNLLLVDDHTIVREGLRRVLEAHHHDWRIHEANSGYQALEHLGRQPVDLVIVDLSMPGMNGLELVKRIKTQHKGTPTLVLSMHAEEQYALRAFKAGANGYITKDSPAAELIAAVSKVAGGGAFVTASLAERVVQQLNGDVGVASHAQLSNRELDVLRRLVSGQRPTEIAKALNLSVKTISSHKTRILEKLQLPSLAAMVRYGLEHKLAYTDLSDPPAALD